MTLCQVNAKARGMASLPMVELPYTIISTPAQAARELADKALESIIKALISPK